MTPDSRFQAHADVVATTLPNKEVVLLHLVSQKYFSLNETGARIWAGIEGGLTLEQIRAKLMEEFDVTAQAALESVTALVEELVAAKLVVQA